MIKIRIHAIAGIIAFLTILSFWLSTLISETLGSHADIAAVKNAILWGMIVLIPCLIMTRATGVSLGKGLADPRISAKKKRMPLIAGNGLIVLVPSAVFLAHLADSGNFGTVFYGVQTLELLVGAVNLALMGLVLFGSTIDCDQLWFRQVGNDLEVSVIGTTDSVTVDEWYSGTSNRLDLDDGNGYTLAAENVEALRNAMASFDPPAFGETELSSSATDYSIVITAIPTSWQSP